ncbi:hypothetical protein TanjilG_23792 [Lupinus angustifolius]|nr:hypothetical protein TanjilG_23792 [Lupinus angustifolius]
MVSSCYGKGKRTWPELVGVKGEVAVSIIKKENPRVREIRILHDNEVILPVLICDRVFVWVDDNEIVVQVPILG